MVYKMKKNVFWLIMLLSFVTFGQNKRVVTSIDTTKNKIGAQFNLTLKTTVDTLSNVVFPEAKMFGQLEVIRSYVVDTVLKNNHYELTKKYGLTQFDSGKYSIPRLKININNKVFLSDSIVVEVNNVAVDTLKQKMYDIKPIIQVANDYSNYWKWLIILLLLATIAYLIYYFKNKNKNQKVEEIVFKTPIEKATTLLKTLENKELWQKGEIKEYYSELTDIARNYIEEAIEIPAMECTTAELILALRSASVKKKMSLSQETLENLEKVLKQADLVKFAKSKPLDFEISEDKNKIEKTILTLDKSIPKVEEEVDDSAKWDELKRIENLKKKRKKNIKLAFGSVGVIAFLIVTLMIVIKGFSYTKDTILGNDSKELLEGEWVSSEYGNPSVIIETPQVLKRIDLSKILPKEGMALIKEMQSFGYGTISDDLYIMISTITFKKENKIDLPKSLENALQVLESQGAQNLLVKQEGFDTKQGIQGIKGYGTFSKIDAIGRSSTNYYYEIILFSQEGGLQQILFFHKEGDEYADEISERMLNSVELKKVENNG